MFHKKDWVKIYYLKKNLSTLTPAHLMVSHMVNMIMSPLCDWWTVLNYLLMQSKVALVSGYEPLYIKINMLLSSILF